MVPGLVLVHTALMSLCCVVIQQTDSPQPNTDVIPKVWLLNTVAQCGSRWRWCCKNNITNTTKATANEEERLVGVLSALDDKRCFRSVPNKPQCSCMVKWEESLIAPTDPAACCEQREAGQRAGMAVKEWMKKNIYWQPSLTLLTPDRAIECNSCAPIRIWIFTLLEYQWCHI